MSAADLALGAGLALTAVLSGLYVDGNRVDTVEPTQWWQWLLLIVPAMLVTVRRMQPIAVPIVGAVVQSLIWIVGLPDVLLPMLIILYSAAADGRGRGVRLAVGITVMLTCVTSVGVFATDEVTPYLVPLVAITCITAIVLGVNAARSRMIAVDLATTIAETRLRSEHEQAEALADERARIARELHDIMGHTLSVIAVRAEAAHRVAARKPEVVEEAVEAIATSARAALTDTRRVLAGLRSSSEVDLAPPPDLAATRQLVVKLAEAGVDAEIEGAPDARCTPSALVAGSAYRIVQEALTNAVQHGPPQVQIRVLLDCDPTHLHVVVTSTLPPPVAATTRSHRRGHGLTGMAERVEVLGGTLSARPEGDRFVVRAALPIDGADPATVVGRPHADGAVAAAGAVGEVNGE